jgi:hypothetical protein
MTYGPFSVVFFVQNEGFSLKPEPALLQSFDIVQSIEYYTNEEICFGIFFFSIVLNEIFGLVSCPLTLHY